MNIKRLMDSRRFVACAIFAISFAIRLIFCVAQVDRHIAFSCDASEYLRDAQGLAHLLQYPASFWMQLASLLIHPGQTALAEQIRTQLQPLHELTIGGPIFPLFLLASFAFFGQAPSEEAWICPVVFQSVLGALTCVVIAGIGERVWDRKTGALAGLVACLYPGFVVNAGRLYSESFAVFLACSVLYLVVSEVVRRRTGLPRAFLLGLLLFMLQVTRSLMVVLLPVSLFVYAFATSRIGRFRATIAILLGFAFLSMPWLLLQYAAFHKASLVVDRVSSYNFCVGNNTRTSGWLSFPYPDCSYGDKRTFAQLAKIEIAPHPLKWAELMLDKPARLLKAPWNDFKLSMGFIPCGVLVFFHQCLLVLSALGVVLTLFDDKLGMTKRPRFVGKMLLLAFALLHCIYFGFITVPRYALTAMPVIILFAAAAVTALWQEATVGRAKRPVLLCLSLSLLFLLITRINLVPVLALVTGGDLAWLLVVFSAIIKAALLLVCALSVGVLLSRNQGAYAHGTLILVLLVVLPLISLPVRANGRWYEWSEEMSEPGDDLTEKLQLDETHLKELVARQPFLLINVEGYRGLINGTLISINGKQLMDPMFIPVIPFLQNLEKFKARGENGIYQECEDVIKDLCLPGNISNLELRQWFLVPLVEGDLDEALVAARLGKHVSITLVKQNDLPINVFGAYRTRKGMLRCSSLSSISWEKAFFGVENDDGLSDPSYDMKISSAYSIPKTNELVKGFRLEAGNYYVRLLASPPTSGKCTFEVQSHIEKDHLALPTGAKQAEFIGLLNGVKPGLSIVRLSGFCRCKTGKERMRTDLVLASVDKTGKQYVYASPWIPRFTEVDKNWQRMDYSFPVRSEAFPGQLHSMELLVRREGRQPAQDIELKDLALRTYNLSNPPLGPGHEVY